MVREYSPADQPTEVTEQDTHQNNTTQPTACSVRAPARVSPGAAGPVQPELHPMDVHHESVKAHCWRRGPVVFVFVEGAPIHPI
jgi:hypothetical protein